MQRQTPEEGWEGKKGCEYNNQHEQLVWVAKHIKMIIYSSKRWKKNNCENAEIVHSYKILSFR